MSNKFDNAVSEILTPLNNMVDNTRALMLNDGIPARQNDVRANVMLAVRHLEDARHRLIYAANEIDDMQQAESDEPDDA